MNAPVETKVVAGGGAAGIVTAVFAVLHWLAPSVPNPPAYIVGLLAMLVSLAAGYFAPHTSRLKPLSQAQADLLDQAAALAHPVQVPPVMNVSAAPPAQPAAGSTP